MSQLQEWFVEHPRARPLIMFTLLGFFCLGLGIWMTARPSPPIVVNRTPDPVATSIPTMVGETPLAMRPKTVWVVQEGTSLYQQPGLNMPVVKKLAQWEELDWLQEQENWDHVRLANGSEGWIQSKFLTFTRPANLDKPNEAEVAVMSFYQAVIRKDYASAYAHLIGPWKAELDFQRFVEGYSRTISLRTEITQVIPLGDSRFQVDVAMTADELGRDVPYLGIYVVEKVGDEWVMSSGSLNRMVAPQSQPSQSLRVPVVETPVPIVESPSSEVTPEDEVIPPVEE